MFSAQQHLTVSILKLFRADACIQNRNEFVIINPIKKNWRKLLDNRWNIFKLRVPLDDWELSLTTESQIHRKALLVCICWWTRIKSNDSTQCCSKTSWSSHSDCESIICKEWHGIICFTYNSVENYKICNDQIMWAFVAMTTVDSTLVIRLVYVFCFLYNVH